MQETSSNQSIEEQHKAKKVEDIYLQTIIYLNGLNIIIDYNQMKKKGKGLSFDQKRERMLAIFHKTKDVYNYQEIQKLSVKASIPFPSVKQILQSLKADSLVQCQKIGAGVFYWSFPSRAHQTMTDRLEITNKQIQTFEKQIQELEESIKNEKVGRQQTSQREQLCSELKDLQHEKKSLADQIQKYIRFDPERYELLVKQNKQLKNMVNVQIDNLEQIRKYIKKNQIGISDQQLQQIYGIPANIQYWDL